MRLRAFFVDTFAMAVSSTVGGMIIELLVTRVTFEQSMHSRLAAIPANIITARPYGLFRDWVFRFTKASNAGHTKKGVIDVLTFVVFQVPLYAVILLTASVEGEKVLTACATLAVFATFIGRPTGMFLDYCRRIFYSTNHSSH